eukprot:m.203399 g.203399  ORF g.203399 m.203399 type:complete len:386 (+) comp13730_c1_seq1:858-2015(+)
MACKDKNKMNLGVGAFRNGEGNPQPLKAVLEAEEALLDMRKKGLLNHEYPAIGGSYELVQHSIDLVLGPNSASLQEHRAVGVQAISGTGSLRLVGEFIASVGSLKKTVHLPNPTWANHKNIFSSCGFDIETYHYFDEKENKLDFGNLKKALRAIPKGDVLVFHACAHNPTGVDTSIDEWKTVAEICKERDFVVVFDCAYLGFASGDMDEDAGAMRLFARLNIEFFVCMSFSKNMGLYDERVGAAMYFSHTASTAEKVLSHLKSHSRAMWSVPPQNGAHIVNYILSNPSRKERWQNEVRGMASRILTLREQLYNGLKKSCKGRSWDHIINQKGMFSYTGLNASEVDRLEKEFCVFMMSSGRISVSGIADGRVPYLVDAITKVLQND